jgi:hypothetical protein
VEYVECGGVCGEWRGQRQGTSYGDRREEHGQVGHIFLNRPEVCGEFIGAWYPENGNSWHSVDGSSNCTMCIGMHGI